MTEAGTASATKRRYRMSKKLLLALEALGSGAADTLAQAAEIGSLTERGLRYALKKENVRMWLREHVVTSFSAGQLAASRTMLGLLRSNNSMTQYRAATWLMGVNGVAPVDNRGPLVSMNMAGSGFIIDLRSDAERTAPLTAEDRTALERCSAGAVLLGSYQSTPMIEATIEPLEE